MKANLFVPSLAALVLCTGCGGQKNKGGSATGTPSADPKAARYEEMLARAKKKAREGRPDERVQEAIARFQQEIGRVPTNLNELVTCRILTELPKPPPGVQYFYAPEMGRVALMSAPPQKRGTTPTGTAAPPVSTEAQPPPP